MNRKNKKYLDDGPLTKYMKTKIRRLDLEEEPVAIEEVLFNENVSPHTSHCVNLECDRLIDESSPDIMNNALQGSLVETISESPSVTYVESSTSIQDSVKSEAIMDEYNNYDLLDHSLEEVFFKSYEEKNNHESILIESLFSDDDDNEAIKSLERSMNKSKSLHAIKSDESFLNSVGTVVDLSPAKLLLMAMKFSLKNNHTFTSLTEICNIVNAICGKRILPETRYMIDKLCNSDDNTVLHSICTTCSKYIGTFDNGQKFVTCDNCNKNVDVSNPSNACYFAALDPSNAIRDYLQSNEEFYDYIVKERVHENDVIEDIYDGKMYRNFVKKVKSVDNNYVSVTFNTDGAPVFKSSSFSIWPIYICIHEIPAQCRLNSVILTGLWFGKNKPEMSIFLKIFTETINRLSSTGIECIIREETRIIKLFAILACADTIARAPMQGTCQFNAHYGCNWCTHPGEYFSGSMRYPYLDSLSNSRHASTTITFANQALQSGKSVFGVKTASPLLLLSNFDIIKSFTPDYMHCLLAGVAKQYTEYIISSMSKSEFDTINSFLTKVKVPYQVGRLARPLTDRANWKSKEWENWVLYYSVPMLTTVFKDKRKLEHWALLTESLHIALQTRIKYAELNHLNQMLHDFVSKAEDLYTLTAMTYNTHQLLHVGECIANWGPLWAHSSFCFESANYYLLRAIKSGKGVIQQIIRHINLERSKQILEKIVHSECLSDIELSYMDFNVPQTKKVYKLSNITYLGKERTVEQLECEKFNVSKTSKLFCRMIMDRVLYMSSAKNNLRSCNFYAQLADGQFIKIISFVVDIEKKNELTFYQLLNVRNHMYLSYVKEIISIENEVASVETRKIKCIAVYIKALKKDYIIATPNSLFY